MSPLLSPEAIRNWIKENDNTIAVLAIKRMGKEGEALTFERSPPMIPQATYDVCTAGLENFVADVLALFTREPP